MFDDIGSSIGFSPVFNKVNLARQKTLADFSDSWSTNLHFAYDSQSPSHQSRIPIFRCLRIFAKRFKLTINYRRYLRVHELLELRSQRLLRTLQYRHPRHHHLQLKRDRREPRLTIGHLFIQHRLDVHLTPLPPRLLARTTSIGRRQIDDLRRTRRRTSNV
jgi:hypothetical protein